MLKNNIFIKYSLLVITLLTILVGCDKKSSDFQVKGTFANISDGYFYATREINDSLIIDTVKVNAKGEFSFGGHVDTLTIINLYFNKNTESTYILVNKGLNVEIKGDVLLPDLISAKGGEINDDLTSFKEKNSNLLEARAKILNSASKNTGQNDSMAVKDYVVELKNINFDLKNVAATYIKSNPDKIASVLLINTFFKDETSIPRLDENLNLLKGKAADFPLTSELKQYSERVKRSAEGAIAPNFTLKNTQGKDVSLYDFRGKYVLLSFVSTTCDVCLLEKKDAIRIYNELKKQKKNIDFIAIVKDIENQPLTKELTDSVNWTILPVNGGWAAPTFEQYYIRELPYNILISPTGIILNRDLPISTLPQKLEELPNKGMK